MRRALPYLVREFEAEVRPAKICPPETVTSQHLVGPAKRRPFDLGPFFKPDLYPGFGLPQAPDAAAEARWANTKEWKRTGGLRPEGGVVVGLSWTGKRQIKDVAVAGVSLRDWKTKQAQWREYEVDKREYTDFWAKAARGEDVTVGEPEYGPNARTKICMTCGVEKNRYAGRVCIPCLAKGAIDDEPEHDPNTRWQPSRHAPQSIHHPKNLPDPADL